MVQSGYEFLIDSREKGRFKDLVSRKGFKYRITALQTDIVLRKLSPSPVEDIVGIEKKLLNDLVQSIQSQRLWKQMKTLKACFKIPMLFVVGDLNAFKFQMKKLKLRINESVIYGTLASVMVREQIHVMWWPSESIALEAAWRICTKVSEGKWGEVRRVGAKIDNFHPTKVLMLVPGIKIDTAKRIMQRFKTLEIVSKLEINDLQRIDGVGPQKAQLIWKLFHMQV